MNRFRYDISTSACKADYVRCTAKVILQHPNEVLYSLCAESIDILANLLHAKEGTFVLNTIGFNGNPKIWCLLQTLSLDSNEWFDIAYGHLVDVYVEEFDEVLNKFYEINAVLLRELMRSDSKKAQEGVKELFG